MASRPVSSESKGIGYRMQRILREKNITQAQAAFRLGLSSPIILNNYLNGRREIPLPVIKEFSKNFNIPATALLGIEQAPVENCTSAGHIDFDRIMAIYDTVDFTLTALKRILPERAKFEIVTKFYNAGYGADNPAVPDEFERAIKLVANG